MPKRYSELLDEEIHYVELPSGLTAYAMARPDYQKKFATYTVHYGSIDNHFKTAEHPQGVRVPDGIAHFLEHKLFESEDVPVFDQFAELGASCNAFTNYTATSYLFSTSDHFARCQAILLDFVRHPHLTEENVAKEKGIIEQELRMYQDDPRWRVFHNLLAALYHEHPVRIDIGGTVASIKEITVDDLMLCYQTFYRPGNMSFFAVGDINPEETLEAVARSVADAKPLSGPIERLLPKEPPSAREQLVEDAMPVAVPLFEMAFKEQDPRREGFLERELCTGLLLESLFSHSAPLYEHLYEEGLINEHFSASYFGEPSFGLTLVGGETPDPERLQEEILAGIARVQEEGLPQEAVERARRKAIGEFLSIFNSPEAIAYSFNAYHLRGYDFFTYLQALERVRFEDVVERLKSHFGQDNYGVSVVRGAR